MLIFLLSFTASIAAEPVSPEVAPIMLSLLLFFSKNKLNKFHKNCNAMSLNANVGP